MMAMPSRTALLDRVNQLDLHLDQLARTVGVSSETLIRWLMGLAPVPAEHRALLADLLQIDPRAVQDTSGH